MTARAPLASAPIDRKIFRQGEVRRLRATFGLWTTVCDEIVRQRRRYCSLRAPLLDARRRRRGRLVISTGDDGQPAAMMRLPLGLIVSRPVGIAILPARKARRTTLAGAFQRKPAALLSPVFCGKSDCTYVWSPGPRELAGLQRGDVITIRYWRWRKAAGPVLSLSHPARHARQLLVVPGRGFAAAVRASIAGAPAPPRK